MTQPPLKPVPAGQPARSATPFLGRGRSSIGAPLDHALSICFYAVRWLDAAILHGMQWYIGIFNLFESCQEYEGHL